MSVSNIPGDLFRFRHDTVKTVLNSFCLTSNIRAECEVYGLFRDLIPVEALEAEEDLQRGRGRQCLVLGAFQEGSKDLHALLDTLADSKLRA